MIEQLILSNLINNENYSRKVIAYVKPEYFQDTTDQIVFTLISEFVEKYNTLPSQESLVVDLSNATGITEDIAKRSKALIETLNPTADVGEQWLVDKTEDFCRKKALYNAVYESIAIMKDRPEESGALPQMLQDALAVSFDNSIGTDFLEDSDKLWDHLHHKEVLVPFDLEYFNKITGGGLSKKTLNVILAGTNVGKSMFMCHQAAAALAMGFNVLYITMEMSEEKIQKRVAANLYDVPLDMFESMPRAIFDAKVAKLKSKTQGRMKIKEYPTTCAGAAHFRHLLNELRIKQQFVPHIIFVDYLNICMSTRMKMGSNVNSYTYIKSIAEELRGLAVEFNVPLVTATQTTRTGFSNSDLGLEDTSESFGLPATADWMIALTTSDELEKLGQLMVKQLKARDHDKKIIKRFVIGVDYSKMRLYDVEQQAQNVHDGPVMDKTDFGQADYERAASPKPFDKNKLKGQGFK